MLVLRFCRDLRFILLMYVRVVNLLRMTQGDLEKSLGWAPVPLFDRDHASDMPVMQVLSVVLW